MWTYADVYGRMQVLADPSSASSYAEDQEVAKAIEKVKEFLKNNT
jgi:hypothetical protein